MLSVLRPSFRSPRAIHRIFQCRTKATSEEIDNLNQIIERVTEAHRVYSSFSQERVDHIFRAAAMAAADNRIPLARFAVQETGMGVMEDKILKNHLAGEYVYNKYKDEKTCGVIDRDPTFGVMTIAEPVGIICAIVPTTNPTSTTIFKSLLALKTRNGIIVSPHPRAKKCTAAAANVVLQAAVKAGAPPNIIACLPEPRSNLIDMLMHHPNIKLIFATGGGAMVKAAYSAGKPAISGGAGNTPVVIDEYADIKRAVSSIIMSKTFDHGVICASEQSMVVVDQRYEQVKDLLKAHQCYVLSDEEMKSMAPILLKDGMINAAAMGLSAISLAKMANLNVPATTRLLIGEVDDVHAKDNYHFAHEKLCAALALVRAKHFDDALDKAEALLEMGGLGHTSVLYTNQGDQRERIVRFGERMKTSRVLINCPASHGGIGDLYNFKQNPSFTLSCGSWGGNSTSENIGPKHLLNRKQVAERAENMMWHKLPKSIYFKRACLPVAFTDLVNKKRALIVTDPFLYKAGYADQVADILLEKGIEVEIFHKVQADPTLATVDEGAVIARRLQPDVIVAIGGGSPMDAAKLIWVQYEHPDTNFEDMALRFMDIRKRIYRFPKMGLKADLICIPTTSGTGSEVTPFAVVTDQRTGLKWPIADYELMPSMAVVDANFVLDMPKGLTAASGIDAVTHALEAYVSVMSTEFSDAQALQALSLMKDYLIVSYEQGRSNPVAREKVHNAGTIAGIAFANAFLGVCHSMAHKLGAEFHIAHGIANALLISNVIRYNAVEYPTKQTAFSQYSHPQAGARYAAIATYLKLHGNTTQERVDSLIAWVDSLKRGLDIPMSIREAGVREDDFLAKVDELALKAWDDQCTGTNPRYPLVEELKQILLDSYYGRPYVENTTKPTYTN